MVPIPGTGLRYLRVATSLRTNILQGVYRPGDQLPRQHDLTKEHNVSFSTLKQALDLLEEEGYVQRKVGQGTYASLPEGISRTALVVDDDLTMLDVFEKALTYHGTSCVVASSGVEAIAKVMDHRFDLIFLDLVMPGMNGVETFRAVREVVPGALVVIVTAYSDSELMAEALEIGPFAVMKKPFTLAELRVVLDYRVSRSPVSRTTRRMSDAQLVAEEVR